MPIRPSKDSYCSLECI